MEMIAVVVKRVGYAPRESRPGRSRDHVTV